MKDIRNQWKSHAKNGDISSTDMATYIIYKGIVGEQSIDQIIIKLHKAFKPISNPNKLANGCTANQSFTYALRAIKYSTFVHWLDDEDTNSILGIAKSILDSNK